MSMTEIELDHIAELARQRMDDGVGHHGEQWRLGGRTAINFMMDMLGRHIAAGQQGAVNLAADAIQYHNAVGPIDAMAAAFSAMDNSDTALEEWPQRAIDALAFAGWAVVPYALPYEVLGEAGISGVFETGNPKHGWDWLVAKTRIGPHGPPADTPKPAGAVPETDGDLVLIERGLIGAACHAIDKKRDAPNLLAKLRAVTMAAGHADAVPAGFGELPAPISNPEAWPANYAGGYNDALNMCYDVIRGHAPQPMTTQGEAVATVVESLANGRALEFHGGYSETLDALPIGTKLYTGPHP